MSECPSCGKFLDTAKPYKCNDCLSSTFPSIYLNMETLHGMCNLQISELIKDRDTWRSLAEGLAWSLKDVLNHGLKYENGETHDADVDKAKEIIEHYDAAKRGTK